MDVPSLLISSSTNSPIFLESNSGFCLFLINIAGDGVLPSSVRCNSLNLIVFPTLPLIIVSPCFGFKNLIRSFIEYPIVKLFVLDNSVCPPVFVTLRRFSPSLFLSDGIVTSVGWVFLNMG